MVMPDIDRKYSLTEIAKELNVVPTFINRVQRETGIGGTTGSQGRVVSFDEQFVRIFRIVKTLRMIGLNFSDIKKLWSLEETLIEENAELIRSYPGHFPVDPDGEIDFPTINLVLHIESICHLKEDGLKEMGDMSMKTGINYLEKLSKFEKYKWEIKKRQKIFDSEWETLKAELNIKMKG
jgi:DNA-binding transcriptional MerR regulator